MLLTELPPGDEMLDQATMKPRGFQIYVKAFEVEIRRNMDGEPREVHYCLYGKVGERENITREAVERLRSSDKWLLIGPVYERWLSEAQVHQQGTPLARWAGAPDRLLKALQAMDVHTIEAFLDMPSEKRRAISVTDMEFHVENAQAFLVAGEDKAQLAHAIAAYKSEDAAKAERIKDLEAELSELKKALELVQAKPRRGKADD